MTLRDGGKGDSPRPLSVTMEEFDKNFDAIFGKKEPIPFAGHVDIGSDESKDGQTITLTKTWEFE